MHNMYVARRQPLTRDTAPPAPSIRLHNAALLSRFSLSLPHSVAVSPRPRLSLLSASVRRLFCLHGCHARVDHVT